MIHRRGTLLAAAVLAGLLAPAARSDRPLLKEVAPTNTWSGSLEDLKLQTEAPKEGFLADAEAFGKLWKAWKVGDKLPEVDFTKQVALVATTRGGRLTLSPRLDANGDLKVVAIATKDLRPGFRYVIVTVPREGIKSVEGKKLEKGKE